MALPATVSAQGATITFGTTAYSARVLTFNPLDGAQVPTIDITALADTTSRKMRAGTLINWDTMTMTVQFDGTRPTLGTHETITILFNGSGSPDPSLAGTGYISGFSVDATGGDEDVVTAQLTITWDGDTAPTFTA